MKPKIVTVTLLILMCTALIALPLSNVSGQPPTGFIILQVSKQGTITSTTAGFVDEPINVQATQYTSSGPYLMWFGDILVDNNTSSGYYVNSNFTIPVLPGGNYTITLTDVTLDQNTTTPFEVNPQYLAKPVAPNAPAQLQEGSNLVLNVSVTGGVPNKAYTAEIMVSQPAPLATNYTRTISFTSNSQGTANTQLAFPDTSFQPSGSTTNYAGQYTVYFNASQSLGQTPFAIGITDLTTYHKGNTVNVRAVGYQSGQTATLTIKFQDNSSVSSQTVTADSQGVITGNWVVPSTAVLGQYNVTITPLSNPKAVLDTQLFNIPGFPVTFRTLNLAGELVPGILVEALDKASSTTYSGTTYLDGIAVINIEEGNYTVKAFWNQVSVSELQISVSGNSSFDIRCSLTDLKIRVQDKSGAVIPFVNLNFTYQYTNRTGAGQIGTISGQTDVFGTFALNSTLPGITYVVDASKYDVVFNSGNNTVSNMPAQPTFQALILCPDETLSLKTIDYSYAALSNARIELIEQTSGIFYTITTDNAGSASVQVTFGQYRVRVYTANNILLNETVVNVLSNTQAQIRAALFNLQVTVKVVDYFGNPISNANVELSRAGISTQSSTTQGDGTAKFNNVIGGEVEITAYPSGNPNSYVSTTLKVQEPTTVQISLAKYALVGPLLMDTSLLATLIVILVAIIIFLLIELYKWKGKSFKLRHKTQVPMDKKEP